MKPHKNNASATTSLTPIAFAIAVAFSMPALAVAQTAGSAEPDKTQSTLPSVTVKASADASAAGLTPEYAGRQVARGGRVGILGNQDTMDTPFNSTSYTNELIQNQQSRSVGDVLLNDPSVRLARGYGNFQELYLIRGFPVYSDDIAYNGLYGLLPRQYVSAEFAERVEVFRGANTFLNGAAPGGSGIGGAVNVLPKRAPNEPLTQLTAGVESGGQAYASADLARRFGEDQRFGVRVNATKREGDTSVDNEHRNLNAAFVGLDYRGRDYRLSADVGHQDHKLNQPRPSVTPSGGIPAAPDASSNFAQPWTHSNERQTFGTVRGEYDINSNVTVWAAGGVRKGNESNVLANPRSTANGTTTSYRFDNNREDHVSTGEIGIRGKFQTGEIQHNVSASASAFKLDSKNAYAFSNFSGFSGNLYNPVAVTSPVPDYYIGGSLANPLTTHKSETSSIAFADTMSLMQDRLLLTVGARHQSIKDETFNYNTGALSTSYDKSRVTPMAGVVFKPSKQISLYANYVEGLVAGEVAPATSGGTPVKNAGEAFAPYRSKQKEIGVKYDGGNLGGSLSVFSTSKPSAFVVDNVFGLNGEQRNRGIELSAYGELQRGLRLLGGVTLLDAKQQKTAGGTYDGKDVIGAPELQGNVGLEWDVPGVPRLTLTGRALYTSSQFADAANTLKVPSWTRFDIGARYLTKIGNQAVTLRASVENLMNRDYWASAGGSGNSGYLVLGAPRTFVMSASVDF
ncbi:MAG: TonB-dependent siderophore receptor [Burkholderiaceae bacterium]|nr:TonB-dependent siderophore receptor [Burkholderiaceae bacterium]